MAKNQSCSGQIVANEFLRCFVHELAPQGEIVGAECRDARVGDTVRVRNPISLCGINLADCSPDWRVIEGSTMVNLDQHVREDFEAPTDYLKWSIDQLSHCLILPHAAHLASKVTKLWPRGATLVTAPQVLPLQVDMAISVKDPGSGLNIRFMRLYDLSLDRFTFRADILFGLIPARYAMSPREIELVALLQEARAEIAAQLEVFRKAA